MPDVLRRVAALVACALVVLACNDDGRTLAPAPTTLPPPTTEATATFLITSPAFVDQSPIPDRFTCAGENIVPPLDIQGVPADAVELALVIDDADASGRIHLFIAGLPPTLERIDEGTLPAEGVVLFNDDGRAGYSGPCPIAGTGVHRYFFTLYALVEPSGLDPQTPTFDARITLGDKASAIAVIEGHYEA